MRIETALKRRDATVTRIRDIYSEARHFGPLSSDMNADIRKAFADYLGPAPQWARAYCDGYRACLTEQLYRDALVYGAFIGGEFYSCHRDRPDYYETKGMGAADFATVAKDSAGHFWAHNLRPYFVGD